MLYALYGQGDRGGAGLDVLRNACRRSCPGVHCAMHDSDFDYSNLCGLVTCGL